MRKRPPDGSDDPGAQIDLVNTCIELENAIANSENPAADLNRLAPEELFVIADGLVDIADLQLTNINARINTIRSGNAERLDVSGLQIRMMGEQIPGSVVNAAQNSFYSLANGGSAGADSLENFGFSEKFGYFVNGSISVGDYDGGANDGTGRQQSADIRSESLTVGTDYRISDAMVIGGGLSVSRNKSDFTTSRGGSKIDTLGLTLFGTWYSTDKGYIDAVIDLGSSGYTVSRQINLTENDENPVIATGDTSALAASLTLGAGRNFNRAGWEFGPYGRLSLTQANIDGYSETTNTRAEGFGSALRINSHDVTSMTLSMGGQASTVINTRKAVIIPQIRAEFETEAERSKDGITANFLADPSATPFTILGNERDSSYLNLGLGSSFQLPKGRSGQVFYETRLLQDNVQQHWLKLGIRFNF